MDKLRVLAYIDDGSVMSTNEKAAQELHDKLSASWQGRGFELHAGKGHSAEPEWDKVGVRVNGVSGAVRPKASRRWRLECGARALLQRPESSSKEIEIIIGHFTTMFLLRRPLLSVFHYCYEWVQKSPKKRQRLPQEVRLEIELAIDLLPLCFSNVKVPYSTWFIVRILLRPTML